MKSVESALFNLMLQKTERITVNIYPELWAGLKELAKILNTSTQMLAGACLMTDAEPLDELRKLEDKIWKTLDLIRDEPAYRYLYFKLTDTNPQFHPSPPVRRNAIVPEKTEPPSTFEANFRIAHALYHHPLAKRLRAYPLIKPIYEHLLKVLKAEIRIKSNWITAIENFVRKGDRNEEGRPDEIHPRRGGDGGDRSGNHQQEKPGENNDKSRERLPEGAEGKVEHTTPAGGNGGNEEGIRASRMHGSANSKANGSAGGADERGNVRGPGSPGENPHKAIPDEELRNDGNGRRKTRRRDD